MCWHSEVEQLWCRLSKKVSDTGSRNKAPSDEHKANLEAQISKGLMGVFMKATQVEEAVTDLILLTDETCCSADSEDMQLSGLFRALGIDYDAEKAADLGGTPCFSGPEGLLLDFFLESVAPAEHHHTDHTEREQKRCCNYAGHKKISVIGLMASEYFRSVLTPSIGSPQAGGRQAIGKAQSMKRSSIAIASAKAALATLDMDGSDSDTGVLWSTLQCPPRISLMHCSHCYLVFVCQALQVVCLHE